MTPDEIDVLVNRLHKFHDFIVEQCAQVADEIDDCDARSMRKIAVAIRALKDK